MRFLANENFPAASVRVLRQAGHDVFSAAEFLAGLEDEIVLQRAHDEQRILITFDRDYGELIFKRRLAAPLGVLYLRFDPDMPVQPAELVLGFRHVRTPLFPSVRGQGLTLDFTAIGGKIPM